MELSILRSAIGKMKVRAVRFFSHPRTIKVLKFMRRHWLGILITIVVVTPFIGIAIFLLKPEKIEYITAEAEIGDLVQTVEAVGEVISEKDLELKFPVSGIVSVVYVDEGDLVTKDQELAALRADPLKAIISAANATLRSEQAALRAAEEGSRPEDIAIAEAELYNKRASLDAAFETLKKSENRLKLLKEEARIELAGYVSVASSSIVEDLSDALTSVRVVEDVFEDLDLRQIIIAYQPVEYTMIENNRKLAEKTILGMQSENAVLKDYQEALSRLTSARNAVALAVDVVNRSYNFVSTQDATGIFTYSDRETLKGTLNTEKASVQDALSDLDTNMKNLRDASAGHDTSIATEQGTYDKADADIRTFQAAVQIAEAQLELKKAGTRQADLDGLRARVSKAYADLQKAQADYNDTILKSPIDAYITKVNLKPGEFTPGQFTTTDPAITILGTSPYRTEMYASEIDIAKIVLRQTGSILLDAFPDDPFDLIVNEIDPAATLVDGVPKYKIVLDFMAPSDRFKIGMTGDVDVITAVKEDAISVPARAVIEKDDDTQIVRILKRGKKIEERPVVTGLETDTDIEIVSGIEEGETVVVLIKK